MLLACASDAVEELAAICGDIELVRLGETGGDALVLEGAVATLEVQVLEAVKAYEEALSRSFA